MLCKLTRKDKTDSGLDITRAHGGALGDAAEFTGFRDNSLEGVSDEVVDNHHTLLGDTRFWVDLLEDLEDVALEGLRCTSLHDSLGSCRLLSS